MIIQTSKHTIEIDSNYEIKSEGNYDIEFVNGDFFKTIKINGSDLITCYEKYGGLFLHHLESPYEGRGFGKLGLAIFYALCKLLEYSKFAIKFGGGRHSESFLLNVGFDKEQVDVVQDVDYGGLSVIAGDIERDGDGFRDWALNHQHISNYPTNFFMIN